MVPSAAADSSEIAESSALLPAPFAPVMTVSSESGVSSFRIER